MRDNYNKSPYLKDACLACLSEFYQAMFRRGEVIVQFVWDIMILEELLEAIDFISTEFHVDYFASVRSNPHRSTSNLKVLQMLKLGSYSEYRDVVRKIFTEHRLKMLVLSFANSSCRNSYFLSRSLDVLDLVRTLKISPSYPQVLPFISNPESVKHLVQVLEHKKTELNDFDERPQEHDELMM